MTAPNKQDAATDERSPFAVRSRPYGRSLSDFGRLYSGEKRLLACSRKGENAVLAAVRPDRQRRGRIVRAEFVRFLALGGDERAPVHEHGVQLSGAWLIGPLDLQGAEARHRLLLINCRIEGIIAIGATLPALFLSGSRIENGLWGDQLRCTGDFFGRNEFEVSGPVRLLGSKIGGSLDLASAKLLNEGGIALALDGAVIDGPVFLNRGFRAVGEVRMFGATLRANLDCQRGAFLNPRAVALGVDGASILGGVMLSDRFYAHGEVRFLGARIGGQLFCVQGLFRNKDGAALSCDRVSVSGSVFLINGFFSTGFVRFSFSTIESNLECVDGKFYNRQGSCFSCEGTKIGGDLLMTSGFKAIGEVRMLGAVISGDFACNGGKFDNSEHVALACDGARVQGAMFFRGLSSFNGAIDVTGMYAATLCNDVSSWNSAKHSVLDGFTYGRFTGGAPTNAEDRVAWLKKQPRAHLNNNFKTQPWEQLIKVLREMGHADDARNVAIAKQQAMRSAKRYVGGSRLWDRIYGGLVGYGFRPWRLLWIAAAVWIMCGAIYALAIRAPSLGAPTYLLAPARADVNVPCLVERITKKSAAPCPRPAPDYSNFVSLAYSAEVLLPVISLGSKSEWRPVLSTADGQPVYWGWAVFIVYWLEIAFGWLAGLLLVAAVGNLVKKE